MHSSCNKFSGSVVFRMDKVKKQTHRQRLAEVTRQSIIQAARNLFITHGYRASTVSAIALEAGVAERTVYNTFATKQELLAAVCSAWLEEAGVRPLIAEALAQKDDLSKLERAARWSRQMHERGLEVEILFDATYWEDPELRSLFDRWASQRKEAMGQVITTLTLRNDLTGESAIALFLALSSATVYRELTEGAGWSPDRYETWLGATLSQQLL
jgi:AcrR family transcriptional regulator